MQTETTTIAATAAATAAEIVRPRCVCLRDMMYRRAGLAAIGLKRRPELLRVRRFLKDLQAQLRLVGATHLLRALGEDCVAEIQRVNRGQSGGLFERLHGDLLRTDRNCTAQCI
jgi:hypothetical protein